MTHEELLAEIDERIEELHNAEVCDSFIHALRAVVELHKPREISEYPKGYFACEECSKWGLQNHFVMLPCPTIRAIEKELK